MVTPSQPGNTLCHFRLWQGRHRRTAPSPSTVINQTSAKSFDEFYRKKDTKAFVNLCKRGTVPMVLPLSPFLGHFDRPPPAASQPHAPAQAIPSF